MKNQHVSPKSLRRLLQNPKAATPSPKADIRKNTFSESRDIREDRGTRQIKMTLNPHTVTHDVE